MSTFWIVTFALLAVWSVGAGIHTVVESHMVSRHRTQLEVRDWQEKVQAMRRLQDEEGDA